MESSQICGGREECHSSESGWTMYIGSPTHGAAADDDDDDDSHSDDGDGADDDHYNTKDDGDSDDSMASDASSGPSHREHPYGNGEHGHGTHAHFKHDEGKDKYSSLKKANNPVEKQRDERRKEEKEELGRKRANTPVQSGGKVRSNSWMSKRK